MNLDFFEHFQAIVHKLSDQVALQHIDQEGKRETFTYRRIAEEISKIGSFLKGQRVGPGATVGILMENHPRWGIAFLAAQSAGARIAPFDVLHESRTLAELIRHAECRFLISSEKLWPKLMEIQALLPQPLPVLATGQPADASFCWEKVLEEAPGHLAFPLTKRELDEPFVLIYTSGTTGNPKGVLLTSRNVYRNTAELLKVVKATDQDHLLSVLPLYHVLALMANFIIPLYVGARVTYLDSLDAQRILRTFQEEGITIFVCVPQFYYLVHRRIFHEIEKQPFLKRFVFRRLLSLSRFCNDRLDRNPGRLLFAPVHKPFGPQFRFFAVGGARFDRAVARSLRDLGFTLVQAYGMTETAALATATPMRADAVGSAGLALPHVEIRIEQPDGNGVGEVLLRGENVMKGYWKNPEATAEILRDGWLYTGDLGYRDANGYLYITGRKKEVIVLSSGKNIFPEELEHFYQSNCPYIKEMCVLGITDPASSEEQEKLHALVVPDFDYMKSQGTANASDIIRYMMETLSQRLPPYKRVRSFEIRRESLPRTTTRKVKRFELEKELREKKPQQEPARFEESATPQTATEEKIFKAIRDMKGSEKIHPDMNLELDLGFESLERVELLSTLQRIFQIQIPDDEAARIFTVKELAAAVERRLSGEIEDVEARLSWREILREPLKPEDQKKVRQILDGVAGGSWLFYLTAKLVQFLSSILFRLQVEGREHLPRQYPYLICPNHLSYADVFVAIPPLPYRLIKRLFFLGYAEYFSGSAMSFLGRIFRVLPVDADRHLRQALRLGAEGLRRGLVLCVFPEGERSIDGKLKAFRKGPAILAKEMNVPVVPAAITGTYEVWPRGVNKIKLHPVTVRLGEPVYPSTEESYEEFNQRLFQAVEKLIGKA